MDVILRVGSTHHISDQKCVLFATGSKIAQTDTCSEWSVAVIPKNTTAVCSERGYEWKGLEIGDLVITRTGEEGSSSSLTLRRYLSFECCYFGF